MRALLIHTRSVRLGGREVLVTKVLTDAGTIGYGLSFALDATRARHMAEWQAGLRTLPPTSSGSSPSRPPGPSASPR